MIRLKKKTIRKQVNGISKLKKVKKKKKVELKKMKIF